MTSEERGIRIDQFIVGTKWMLAILGLMAALSFVVTLGSISDSRRQTIEAISELKKQVDLLKDQNHWSIQDRADLHETQGRIAETLKRLEGRK